MAVTYFSLDDSDPNQRAIKNRIDRNLEILREGWIKELYDGVDYIEKNMSSVLIKGILKKLEKVTENISAGVIKKIYDIFLADLKEKTVKQIDIIIQCAKLYDRTNLNDLMEKYTKDYLKFDLTCKSCSKSHQNFKQLENFQVSTFRHRIVQTNELMLCDGGIKTDTDIIRETYKDYDIAKKELFKQIGYTRKAINLLFEDDSILKVNPVIKRPVLDVLRMGYEYALNHLISTCKEIFNK